MVVNCFQIRNFVISNNRINFYLCYNLVVNCFQIRNFVISNNEIKEEFPNISVVNCFQIRNFVISNNFDEYGNEVIYCCELLSNS